MDEVRKELLGEIFEYLRQNHPSVPVRLEDGTLTVPPDGQGGMNVTLFFEGFEYILQTGFEHIHETEECRVKFLFLAALTPHVRVWERRLGGTPYQGRLECNPGGRWVAILESWGAAPKSLFFWRKPKETYFSNNYLQNLDYVKEYLALDLKEGLNELQE